MQRAVASVGDNIAEGYAGRGPRNRARFFAMAKTSAEELRHSIILTQMLGHLSPQDLSEAQVDEVCAMLCRLWESNCPSDERQGVRFSPVFPAPCFRIPVSGLGVQ